MKILAAADDSGSLKQIICKRGTDTSVQGSVQPDSITSICEETRATRVQQFILFEDYLITTRAKGSICFYRDSENEEGTTTKELVHRFEGCSINAEDPFVSLIESFGMIYTCTEAGRISIVNPNDLKQDPIHVDVKGPISDFIAHPLQKGVFAYGGKENDIKIISLFDVVTTKSKLTSKMIKLETLFQGKNVKNDKLDLRVPIWISRIHFVEAAVKRGVWKFITVTRYGQIRKYDTSHGRKPISNVKVSEKPLVTLVPGAEANEIICSDIHMTTAKYDINKGTLIGKYKGAVGAVQSLNTFMEGNLLVTGGLDRYARAFDIDSREQVAKVYIGSQISHIAILEDDEEEETQEEVVEYYRNGKIKKKRPVLDQEEEEKDDEEMWNKLDNTNNKKSSKKQKV